MGDPWRKWASIRRSAGRHGLIYAMVRKLEAGTDVFRLQVWQLVQNCLLGEACPKQIKHIRHSDSHAPDARPSSTLLRVDGDAG